MSKYQFRQSDIYRPGTDLPVNQGEPIAPHPFYELNGRITRLFFDLITIANGYGPIDYGRALQDDPEVDNNYIRASIGALHAVDGGPDAVVVHLWVVLQGAGVVDRAITVGDGDQVKKQTGAAQ